MSTLWQYPPGRFPTGGGSLTTWGMFPHRTGTGGLTTYLNPALCQALPFSRLLLPSLQRDGMMHNLLVVPATLVHHVDSSHQTFTNSWCLGTGVVQHDVDCFGLSKAVEWLVLHFSDLQWHMPTHVYILMGSLAVLMSITNVQGHMNQHEHLHFHSVLMTHCAQFPGLHFTMVWSPPVWTRIMDTTAWFKALQACQITLRASLTCLQSAAYSKAITWEHTFSLWAKEWQAKWDKELWPSFAYKYALCGRSSNGSNHPLWNSAVHTTLDAEMGHFLPMFLHHTTSITLCLVVGHMFTSNYPWRFWPNIPWDQHACTCGWPTHSFHHLLYECPHGHKYCQWSPFWWSSCDPEYFFTKELTPSSTTSNPHP